MGCCYSIKPFDDSELTQGLKITDTIVADFKKFGSAALFEPLGIVDDQTRDGKFADNDGDQSDLSPLKLPEYTSENSIASWKNPSTPLDFK